jgi:hypothetical protein
MTLDGCCHTVSSQRKDQRVDIGVLEVDQVGQARGNSTPYRGNGGREGTLEIGSGWSAVACPVPSRNE